METKKNNHLVVANETVIDTSVVRPKSSYAKSAQLMRRRAKSSMPVRSQQNENNDGQNEINSMKTVSYRPVTSNGFRVPFNLSDPIGITHYDETFDEKPLKLVEPIRAATASGNRCNKPHPTKDFMIFRFKPLKPITNEKSDWSQLISDTLIKDVIRRQMKSTYSTDYVNNVEAKKEFEERCRLSTMPTTISYLEWKAQRELEQKKINDKEIPLNKPFSYESMFISPTRYGSNINHQQAAYGIIPGCSRFWHDYGMVKKSTLSEINFE